MPIANIPAVSIIIPTFNRATLLPAAIDSVLAQTFTDYEIIVVDDGSKDATREALEGYIGAGQIRYLYQENRGESAARNRGMWLAAGQYLVFLDSDDLLLPRTLEKQVACLAGNSDAGLVHGNYVKFNSSCDNLGLRDTSRLAGWVYPSMLLEWTTLMAVPTVMVRTPLLRELGGFDESMRQAGDLDMWRRLARRTRFMVIPEVLARVRVHEHSISADKSRAAAVFEAYVRNAFSDDPALGAVYRRRILAGMYANVGTTLLGDGEDSHMALVRQYCARSLRTWPFQTRALLGLGGSLLGSGLRRRLADRWRQLCYPRGLP